MSKGSGYVSRAMTGGDSQPIVVNEKYYMIPSPTIETIAKVGEALCDEQESKDVRGILYNILHAEAYVKALSRMIIGDDSLVDALLEGTTDEILNGLETGLSMLSIDIWEKVIGFDRERSAGGETAGNATLLGQVATFMENLHLTYNEAYREIPFRNLLVMQKDKLHTVTGTKIKKISGKEMASRRMKKGE